jgi:putative hydrolase of the HAD superfamily
MMERSRFATNTIIFDMYGVIIKESKGNFIPYTYSHFPGTDFNLLKALFTKAGLGEIDSDAFLKQLGFTDTVFHMHDYIENHLTMDNDFYSFAEKFEDKYDFALLSNDVLAWNQYILQHYDIAQYFPHGIVSAEVHARKPDKAIYDITLSRLGIPASACIFIDNSVANLLAASALGMDTVLFNRDNEAYDGKTVYSFSELDDLLSGI